MSDKDRETDGEKILGCGLLLVMIPLMIALKGFVLSQLWAYFLVPLGVGAITLAHGLGLSILATLFTGRSSRTRKDETMSEVVGRAFFYGIVGPLLVWGLGWCFHALMQTGW